MSYSENYWTSDASVLECTGWANPRNTSSTIRKLQKIKFTYQEERNSVADLIDELNGDLTDCIYGIDKQFPDKKSYAPILCDEIQEAIKAVILAASYRPPDVSETNKDLTVKSTTHSIKRQGSSKDDEKQTDDSKDNTTITSLSERVRLEKSQKAYYEAVKSLAVALKGCTLNRVTFESKYSLTWSS